MVIIFPKRRPAFSLRSSKEQLFVIIVERCKWQYISPSE